MEEYISTPSYERVDWTVAPHHPPGPASRRAAGPPLSSCEDVHTCVWAEQAELLDGLLADYEAKMSARQLASAYPWSRSTISRILAAHGVQIRSRAESCTRVDLDLADLHRRRSAGETWVTLAADLGITRQGLTRRLRDYRRAMGESA